MSTLITIDLEALRANFRRCRQDLSPAKCAAVVKADAYGLGVGRIGPILWQAGCRHFFTATHREGVMLRELLPDAEIYVFEGVTPDSTAAFTEHGLIPVLITSAMGSLWVDHAKTLDHPLPAVIHIDSGMTRLGFGESDLRRFVAMAGVPDRLDVRFVMTHLACADDPESDFSRRQLERFDRLRALLPPAPTSIGNSAGTLLGRKFSGDLARAGIALYGGNPCLEGDAPWEAVLRVQSRILQLREVEEDTPVGYGATHTVPAGTRIATVGTGYADGYPWSLGNRGVAAIEGYRVPVIGRVSMDLITLDVSGVPEELVQPGCLVDLIGPDISLEEVAELAGTINYEILTRLGQRARRRFLGGANPE